MTGFLKSREFWILRWARNEECSRHQMLKAIVWQPARKWEPQTHSHRNWNLSTTWMILEVILSQHLQIRAKLDSILIFPLWERRCSSAFPDFWLEGLWYKRAVSSHFVGGLLYRKRELCPWGYQQQHNNTPSLKVWVPNLKVPSFKFPWYQKKLCSVSFSVNCRPPQVPFSRFPDSECPNFLPDSVNLKNVNCFLKLYSLSSVFPLWFYYSSMLVKQFLVSNSFC